MMETFQKLVAVILLGKLGEALKGFPFLESDIVKLFFLNLNVRNRIFRK